ncbi:MAG: homoserine kinase [Actinomycetota bacterium]|nr:homoserine kinase [Actinomycetota bacterium]
MRRRRLVRAPASSANLGPGYDVLAAALQLHLELEVEETGEFAVQTDLDVPRDRSNLVVQAFERLHPADDFTFTIRSPIPVAGGLGSSAAAIVSGVMAADHLFELDADLLATATEVEGHPDNVAAALLGGFVVCADGRATRIEVPAGLEAVVVQPDAPPIPTTEARAELPAEIPLADVVHNVAHAALLVLGLSQGDWDLVARGLNDRVHQPRRGRLYPRSLELASRATDLGALGGTISGAGPAVLVWTHYEQTAGVVEALRREAPDSRISRVPFEPEGAQVREL